MTSPAPLWIFGYGSLVWRPDMPFEEQLPAAISGWTRRFWQGSTDHRGTPEAPGRVVTLHPEPEAWCWGMAFRIAPRDADAVMAALLHREKGGYLHEARTLRFRDAGRAPAEALVFIAGPDNPNYLGPAATESIVAQIAVSTGPSGPNDEYVYRLAEALRSIGADDPHVFEIEAALRRHQGEADLT